MCVCARVCAVRRDINKGIGIPDAAVSTENKLTKKDKDIGLLLGPFPVSQVGAKHLRSVAHLVTPVSGRGFAAAFTVS